MGGESYEFLLRTLPGNLGVVFCVIVALIPTASYCHKGSETLALLFMCTE